jgi:hypothetical protein
LKKTNSPSFYFEFEKVTEQFVIKLKEQVSIEFAKAIEFVAAMVSKLQKVCSHFEFLLFVD